MRLMGFSPSAMAATCCAIWSIIGSKRSAAESSSGIASERNAGRERKRGRDDESVESLTVDAIEIA